MERMQMTQVVPDVGSNLTHWCSKGPVPAGGVGQAGLRSSWLGQEMHLGGRRGRARTLSQCLGGTAPAARCGKSHICATAAGSARGRSAPPAGSPPGKVKAHSSGCLYFKSVAGRAPSLTVPALPVQQVAAIHLVLQWDVGLRSAITRPRELLDAKHDTPAGHTLERRSVV